MKKILLILLVSFSMKASAQLTLEHTYDSASVCNTCNGNINQLMMVNFEVSGERYVQINRCGGRLVTYDMNHTVVKNISLSFLPRDASNEIGTILYLSENLFNLDAQMEFMYVYQNPTLGFYTTDIYNENGMLLFSENGAPLVLPNVPQQQCPIYNTSYGTKLILSYANGQAKVFGLPGNLTTGIEAFNQNLLSSSNFISNPYPNPTNSTTRVEYTLPEGISEGELVFYDVAGNEVKRIHVDNSSDHLSISTSDISAGTYYYQLQTALKNSEGKKMVVIKQN